MKIQKDKVISIALVISFSYSIYLHFEISEQETLSYYQYEDAKNSAGAEIYRLENEIEKLHNHIEDIESSYLRED